MSNITSQEVLALFSQAAAVNNGDQFLIHATGAGGNNAVKVTAEVVRAYLLHGRDFNQLYTEIDAINQKMDYSETTITDITSL
jgi:hypothetical protein